MHLIWQTLQESLNTSIEKEFSNKRLHQDIRLVSQMFTEDRAKRKVDYFKNKHLLRAYALYFLPLNYQKAYRLLESHAHLFSPDFFQKKNKLRVIDFGSGPGTMTLAFLEWISKKIPEEKRKSFEIEILSIESQEPAIDLGLALIEEHVKDLKLQIQLNYADEYEPSAQSYDFLLSANVLNELGSGDPLVDLLEDLDGIAFFLEPSHRVSSQKLIRLRDRVLKQYPDHLQILGPCLHQKTCPLLRSKHWCHFSEKQTDPTLEKMSLRAFDDPRLWIKFSYLLLTKSKQALAEKEATKVNEKAPTWYRLIGDLHPSGPGNLAIDLCQPQEKRALKLSTRTPFPIQSKLQRGNKILLDETGKHFVIKKAYPLTSKKSKL